MKQTIIENIHFARQYAQNLAAISSVVPTSKWAGREMASEVARHRSPRRVLEVGAGTGAISAEIAPLLSAEDELWLCEINAEFVNYLRQRIARDARVQHVRERIHIHEGSILNLPDDARFDHIISALPFNSFPLELVQQILDLYHRILNPGGTLSYIEYVGGRTVKKIFKAGDDGSDVHALLQHELTEYQFRRAVVLANVPPAWVHHLRFSEVQPVDAYSLLPTQRDQINLGLLTADRDVLPWIIGLFTAASIFNRRLLALLVLPVLLFFRDPPRTTISDKNTVYAGADGKVLAVDRVRETALGEREWHRIAVFLSILDVHVNRSPVAGKVERVWTQQGAFVAANQQNAVHNHSVYTWIETTKGPCVVAQRVGAVARRIVNRTSSQNLLAQGEKFGLMRFGSRLDVYVPADEATPTVSIGQVVRAGETPIARYHIKDD